MPRPRRKDPRVQQKRRDAIALRNSGATLQQIADTVGYANRGGASRAIAEGLRDALHEAGSEEVRALELGRIDRLQLAWWDRALGLAGDPDDTAAGIVLKCIALRAKLTGLEAPKVRINATMENHEHRHVHVDATTDQLADILGAISEVRGDHPALDGVRAIESSSDRHTEVDEVHPAHTVPEADGVPPTR